MPDRLQAEAAGSRLNRHHQPINAAPVLVDRHMARRAMAAQAAAGPADGDSAPAIIDSACWPQPSASAKPEPRH
jgi:hypothetical protein